MLETSKGEAEREKREQQKVAILKDIGDCSAGKHFGERRTKKVVL
jgi:hypothetical protein